MVINILMPIQHLIVIYDKDKKMKIENAEYYLCGYPENQWKQIKATINGEEMYIPLDENNTHYEEIMKQVEAGTLTIKDVE